MRALLAVAAIAVLLWVGFHILDRGFEVQDRFGAPVTTSTR